MHETNRLLLSPRGLMLLVSLVVPGLAPLGCYSAPPASSGSGGSPGSGGQTSGSGGGMASGGDTGTGGGTNTGSGGTTGGSGGTTGGSGGADVGSGGSTGSGGQTGTGTGGRAGGTATGGRGTGGTAGMANGGTTGSGGRTGSGGTTGSGGRSGPLRIMLLGDSTTSSICYRSHLHQLLVAAGHANPSQFDFIGTRKGDPGCGFTGYDQDNEGHGGYIVTDILKPTRTSRPGGADPTDLFDSSAKDLATWFDGHPADVVLMHFGTNDIWNNFTPQNILNAYSAILTRLRTNNANVRVLVAQITPLNPAGCATCNTRVQALNAVIPGWATQNSTTQSPVSVVDQFTGFNLGTDSVDGVHATDPGSVKIATKWYNALVPLF
jgi:GDSL-like Lipase/Acylhydrolase family